MDRIFISELRIKNVRHLKNIRIPLSSDKAKHLILTGKNGSGKTSVLEDLSNYFMTMAESIGRDRDGKTAFLVQEGDKASIYRSSGRGERYCCDDDRRRGGDQRGGAS